MKVTSVNKSWLLHISDLNKVDMASKSSNSHCTRGWTALHT